MRRTVDASLDRSRGACRVKARCSGRCAGCSCGRDSAVRLGYRARRLQAYSRTHAASRAVVRQGFLAPRAAMLRTRPGASILHCDRDALHAAASPFTTVKKKYIMYTVGDAQAK